MTIIQALGQLADVLNELAHVRDDITSGGYNICEVLESLEDGVNRGDVALTDITAKLGIDLPNQAV